MNEKIAAQDIAKSLKMLGYSNDNVAMVISSIQIPLTQYIRKITADVGGLRYEPTHGSRTIH